MLTVETAFLVLQSMASSRLALPSEQGSGGEGGEMGEGGEGGEMGVAQNSPFIALEVVLCV